MILTMMEKENKLTKKQAAELKKLPLRFEKQDKQTTAKTAPYFYDEAVKEMVERGVYVVAAGFCLLRCQMQQARDFFNRFVIKVRSGFSGCLLILFFKAERQFFGLSLPQMYISLFCSGDCQN